MMNRDEIVERLISGDPSICWQVKPDLMFGRSYPSAADCRGLDGYT